MGLISAEKFSPATLILLSSDPPFRFVFLYYQLIKNVRIQIQKLKTNNNFNFETPVSALFKAPVSTLIKTSAN